MDSRDPMSRHLAALAFAPAVLLGVGHALGYSTVLPARVAPRFDASGVPDAWSSRSTMLDLQLTVIVAVAAARPSPAAAATAQGRGQSMPATAAARKGTKARAASRLPALLGWLSLARAG